MDVIKLVFEYVTDIGASVSMPIIITLLGMFAGLGFKRSLRSGLMYGVGFTGLNCILDMFLASLGGAAKAMVEHWGLNFEAIDAGWTLGASLAFSSSLMPLVFISVLLVNFLLVIIGFVKTLDIDVWNYWMFIAGGAIVQQITGSYLIGLGSSVLMAVIVIKVADILAKHAWEMGVIPEGVSLPHTDTLSLSPFYFAVNWVIDRIPVVKDWNIAYETVQDRFGVFGEPVFIGSVLGMIFGVLADYNVKDTLNLAVSLGASMVLLPRIVGILMEGLTPIADAAHETIKRRLKGKEVYIGLDAAVAVGHPAVMGLGVIMVPVILVLSTLLPGNRVLLFGSLTGIPFFMIWAVIASKGNLFRGVICGIVGCCVLLWSATYVAEPFTAAVIASNIPIEGNLVSGLAVGNPMFSLFIALARWLHSLVF